MVTLAQLDPQTVTWWWATLAAGAVVLVVLVLLLRTLARVADDIDHELTRVWTSGKRLAGNTATTWLIDATAASLEALDTELEAVADERRRR